MATRTPKGGRGGALAAGAARASGERAKRRSTPLIAGSQETEPEVAAPTAGRPAGADRSGGARPVHRPHPVAKPVPTKKVVATSGTRAPRRRRAGTSSGGTADAARAVTAAATTAGAARGATPPGAADPAPARRLRAVRDDAVRDDAMRDGAVPEGLAGTGPAGVAAGSAGVAAGSAGVAAGSAGHTSVTPGMEELLATGVAALRLAARASGLSGEEVERQVAQTLAFLRRRLTGDYTVDEFGFDRDFTENAYLPLLRPLYRRWFRVDVRGLENIPAEGGALVVANHSGTIAMDSLMTQVAVHDEHPAGRHLRMLGADLVFSTPVIGELARKSGSTLAANPDAERLLSAGELVGVWPEGFKGIGKPFSERYKLQRFGRGGFVSAALRAGAPIIPCSIVGAEEIYPMIGNMRTVARLVGAPYAPITPTWPLLGPLGLIPLPSKWIIEFGAPVETADLGSGAADDPMVVFDLTDRVRETIQQTLYALLMQRRSVFF